MSKFCAFYILMVENLMIILNFNHRVKMLIRKEKKNSRSLILKEAFKLFLQKNIEKVTVPELERVTGLHRGAIFYHFKDKEAIFTEVIDLYFFSNLNIFYPLVPKSNLSINDYIQKKNSRLDHIIRWFREEGIDLNPYISFIHLMSQACLYIPGFKSRMLDLLEMDKSYWQEVILSDKEITIRKISSEYIGELFQSVYINKCFTACYNTKKDNSQLMDCDCGNILNMLLDL